VLCWTKSNGFGNKSAIDYTKYITCIQVSLPHSAYIPYSFLCGLDPGSKTAEIMFKIKKWKRARDVMSCWPRFRIYGSFGVDLVLGIMRGSNT
jgi:hypothetical protein